MSQSLLIMLVMILLAVAGVILTVVLIVRTRQFVATALRVPGTITGVERRMSRNDETGRRRPMYSAVFSFIGPDGTEQNLTSSMRSSSRPNVGEAVTILVAPDNAQKARIDSFSSVWGFSVIMALVTVAFVVVSVIMISISIR